MRSRFRWGLAAVLLGLWPGRSQGELGLTPAGDPSRFWSLSELTTIGYDDNVNTTPTNLSNRLGSATIDVQPQFSVKFPGDQTSGQLRYTYDATFYTDRNASPPEQSHSVDASLTHAFTPRMTTTLTETFRRGLQPELVQQQLSGVPIITRERGDYSYNNVNAGGSFQMTSRWNLSVNQSWDRWLFDVANEAAVNNRDDYTSVLSSSYALNAQTFVGGSYQFSLTDYSITSATNSARNSQSQSLYATLVHRFNPLLSAQANVGAQFTGFSGATDLSPYLNLSSAYNFGANSSVSAGINYNLQTTEVAVYRSVGQASSYVTLQYRATPKLRTTLEFSYVISTYQNLNPLYNDPNNVTQKNTANEDSWRIAVTANYDFTPWAALYLNYTYNEVNSGLDNPITGLFRSFNQNQCGAGIRLSY